MDYIRTAAGSEASDQSFRAVSSKPNWFLKPLPFSQLRPDYEPHQTSDVKSLASCALTAISLKFDQFPLDSFGSLPPHLIRRIISRVRADRNYDEDTYGEVSTHPDETTIWAIQALYLPQEADDHVLGLPSGHLLQHMQKHPITLLPTLDLQKDLSGLSAPTNFQFLTTISLSVSDGPINDQNIQELRWCTHLTGLWMHGCGVSDYGITLLASALELPGMKGLCRLRAWSLVRCKGITDKSMKTLAKFPGLVMLDLRETSCTDVAIDIFNRQSATLFPHPSFQPCTPGLLDLFSTEKTPSEVLSYLCSTLMKTIDYTALHIVPSTVQISPHFTPFPNLPAPPPSYRSARGQPTYRADGVGFIYGQDVSHTANPVGELRQAVKNLPIAWQIQDDEEKGIVRKRARGDWDKEGNVRYVRQAWREEKKPKPKIFDPEKKRRAKKVAPEIKGDPKLMMVRIIQDGWDQLNWGTSVRAVSTIKTSASGSSSQVRSAKAGNMVNDLFGATKVKPSGPFRPTQSSSPASSPPSESNRAVRIPIRPSLNPFRISSTSSQDIKPLKIRSSSPISSEDSTFTSSQPKRRFGGSDTENKRRSGMKMFTINAKI